MPERAPAAGYTITDLGDLGGGNSYGYGINASGQVTGYSRIGNDEHAFFWTNGTMQDLGTLTSLPSQPGSGPFSYGTAISASGQVVGYSTPHWGQAGYPTAFNWNDGSMQNLGDGYRPMAINASGRIAGYQEYYGNPGQAVVWNGSSWINLGSLGGSYGGAYGISDNGLVTGFSFPAGNAVQHAFIWNGSTMQDIGTLGGSNSRGLSINSSGWITGFSQLAGDTTTAAFIWNGAAISLIGNLGSCSGTVGYSINAQGWVVGTGCNGPFLWNNSTIIDLNSLLPAGSGWVLSEARGINDLGQITGTGYYNGNYNDARAILMTPVSDIPEAATLALFGIGLLGLGAAKRSKRSSLWFGDLADDRARSNKNPRPRRAAAPIVPTFLMTGMFGAKAQADSYAITDLGTIEGPYSAGYSINASGRVTGDSSANGATRAFIWTGGKMQDSGTLAGSSSAGGRLMRFC
jgi:probable HAF family extracellular repeat protein